MASHLNNILLPATVDPENEHWSMKVSNSTDYQPPKIWAWDKSKGGSSVTSLNRPVAGCHP